MGSLVNKSHVSCDVSVIFLFSIWALIISSGTITSSIIPCADDTCSMFANADSDFQEHNGGIGKRWLSEDKREVSSMGWVADGPGSLPPNCTNKCGKHCKKPCKPVLKTLPSGDPKYYHTVWVCTCGGK
ncbi:hypothetical protein VNO78_31348 [Psophocarpus tetragonolobus]|uniref:Epidermal patterning factor-like protein n=1 Tax=Psophocarpus tetragonolobus TaxID=3891 RepID=A0AAN9RZ40_PSOTE